MVVEYGEDYNTKMIYWLWWETIGRRYEYGDSGLYLQIVHKVMDKEW